MLAVPTIPTMRSTKDSTLMRIISEMEPCQYENTDLVMELLLELYEVRTSLAHSDHPSGQQLVLAKLDSVITNLEAVDAHNSRIEHSLLEYRALKRGSRPLPSLGL